MIYDTKDMLQNTRHGVTDFTVDGMVRDTKYLISRERNITFPRNKKIFNCTSETKLSEITLF